MGHRRFIKVCVLVVAAAPPLYFHGDFPTAWSEGGWHLAVYVALLALWLAALIGLAIVEDRLVERAATGQLYRAANKQMGYRFALTVISRIAVDLAQGLNRALGNSLSEQTVRAATEHLSEERTLELICDQLWLTLTTWEKERHSSNPASFRVALYQPAADAAGQQKMYLTHYANESKFPPYARRNRIGFASGEGIIGSCWAHARTVTAPTGSADPRFEDKTEERNVIRSLLTTPASNLDRGGEVLAILAIDSATLGFFPADGTPEAEDVDRMIAPFRDMVSVAILGQRIFNLRPTSPAVLGSPGGEPPSA